MQFMDLKVLTSSKENNYIRVTVVISYLILKENEYDHSVVLIDDCYPEMINTHNLINNLRSNDNYKITALEYNYESIPFHDTHPYLANTIH